MGGGGGSAVMHPGASAGMASVWVASVCVHGDHFFCIMGFVCMCAYVCVCACVCVCVRLWNALCLRREPGKTVDHYEDDVLMNGTNCGNR